MSQNSLFFVFIILLVLSPFVVLIPQVNALTNRFSNEGFELGNMNFWVYTGSSTQANSTYKHTGSYSCKTNGSEYGYIEQTFSPFINTTSITELSVWLFNSLGGSGIAKFTAFYSDGTNSSSGNTGVGNSWSQTYYNGYITTAKALSSVRFYDNSLGGQNVWFDDFILYGDNVGNITYEHTWNPVVEPQSTYNNSLVMNQSTSYVYTEWIYVNGVLYDGIGTYYISTTGLTEWFVWIFSHLPFTQVLTGNIVNGTFNFTVTPRTYNPPKNGIYESIKVRTVIVSLGETYDYTERYYIMYQASNQVPSPFITPPAGYGSLDLTMWFVLFLIILVPIMILGFVFGKSGLLIGMVYSVGIGVSTKLLDPWFIVVIVIALVAVLYDMFRGR